MARNRSEKRSPDEQAAYEYIKAWVEYSCNELGDSYYKEGRNETSFGWGPGNAKWRATPARAKDIVRAVPMHHRRKWLHGQK